jgi:hypothetical protein
MSVETAEPLVPIAVASRATGVGYSLLRRLIGQGRIPSVRVCGVPRVRISAVRAAIDAQ